MTFLLVLAIIYICSAVICKIFVCYHVIVEQGTWGEIMLLFLISASPLINTFVAWAIISDTSKLVAEWFIELEFWHKPVWKKSLKKDA